MTWVVLSEDIKLLYANQQDPKAATAVIIIKVNSTFDFSVGFVFKILSGFFLVILKVFLILFLFAIIFSAAKTIW